jgi:hypothetical protein
MESLTHLPNADEQSVNGLEFIVEREMIVSNQFYF